MVTKCINWSLFHKWIVDQLCFKNRSRHFTKYYQWISAIIHQLLGFEIWERLLYLLKHTDKFDPKHVRTKEFELNSFSIPLFGCASHINDNLGCNCYINILLHETGIQKLRACHKPLLMVYIITVLFPTSNILLSELKSFITYASNVKL